MANTPNGRGSCSSVLSASFHATTSDDKKSSTQTLSDRRCRNKKEIKLLKKRSSLLTISTALESEGPLIEQGTTQDGTPPSSDASQNQPRTSNLASSSSSSNTKSDAEIKSRHTTVVQGRRDANAEASLDSSLQLSAPWHYYRNHICAELAKYCRVCDAETSTTVTMKRGFPSFYVGERRRTLWNNYDYHNCTQGLEEQLGDLCS